jgi:CheY-like chemotaxis protein
LADFSLGIGERSDLRKVLPMDILLVDDNPDYLLLVREALYSHGYTVHTAQDGIEGCEVLASSDIDLIISDIRMPRFDGLKLHAFAREMERYKDTKFVFVSGIKGAYQDVVNINPRIDFFLEKTTSLKDIIKFVDTLVFGRYEGEWV